MSEMSERIAGTAAVALVVCPICTKENGLLADGSLWECCAHLEAVEIVPAGFSFRFGIRVMVRDYNRIEREK
jgi:hypothetical protein